MSHKVLVTVLEQDVAPRFDLTTEILINTYSDDGSIVQTQNMVLAHASAEDLCQLILNERVDVVICGGIEEEFLSYLGWKKVSVMDSVMGPWKMALERWADRELETGAILFDCGEDFGNGG